MDNLTSWSTDSLPYSNRNFNASLLHMLFDEDDILSTHRNNKFIHLLHPSHSQTFFAHEHHDAKRLLFSSFWHPHTKNPWNFIACPSHVCKTALEREQQPLATKEISIRDTDRQMWTMFCALLHTFLHLVSPSFRPRYIFIYLYIIFSIMYPMLQQIYIFEILEL